LGEYLASGRPVVITRTGDIGRYLTDGADSRLVPPDDVDALTGALRDVLAHPEAARALGEAGRRVALANFDYRAAGSMLSDALRRVGRARS
jgi:glycosyltransferase involved in cell wall biosynthesis